MAGRVSGRAEHAAQGALRHVQLASYLVKARVLDHNPMRSISAPPSGAPRLRYLDVPDMKRLTNCQQEPFCAFSALLGGTEIDVSTALSLRKRDVDAPRREIRAAGSQTHSRDGVVRVVEWAWPYIKQRHAALRPNDLFCAAVDRWTAGDAHRAACIRAEIQDYQMGDQRHSYAVRADRAGTPAELIARQLGHANAVLVLKVYGRVMPSQQEREKWENSGPPARRGSCPNRRGILYSCLHASAKRHEPTTRK